MHGVLNHSGLWMPFRLALSLVSCGRKAYSCKNPRSKSLCSQSKLIHFYVTFFILIPMGGEKFKFCA